MSLLGQLELTSATLKISSKPPMAAFNGGPASGTPSTTGAAIVRTVLTPSCTWRLQESSREGPAAIISADRKASAMCGEPIANIDSDFERAVEIFELGFLSMGFHFRTAITLPNMDKGGEVDLVVI